MGSGSASRPLPRGPDAACAGSVAAGALGEALSEPVLTGAGVLAEELRCLVVVVARGDVADPVRQLAHAKEPRTHVATLLGRDRPGLWIADQPHDIVVVSARQQGRVLAVAVLARDLGHTPRACGRAEQGERERYES